MDTPSTSAVVREQLRSKRNELMSAELERVALRLFHERSYASVTVDEIATEAGISARTFYRYFPTKEQVMQVRIDVRSVALSAALALRPADEAPLHAVRAALLEVMATADTQLMRWWISIISATPELVPGAIGGAQLKLQRPIAAFLAERLSVPNDAFAPVALAAAIGGVVQASLYRWFTDESDLPSTITAGLDALALIAAEPAP